MAKIRIGNDIAVTWTLKDGEGNPYDLTGRNVEVHLRSFYVDEQMTFEVTGESNNVASFTFYGKDQHAPGKYNLLLIENKREVAQVVFDVKDVFELVKHSWETDDESAEGITTESVQIVSTVSEGIVGPRGLTGNGIASAVLNPDYTLTLNFTDGTSYTTTSIRGAQGAKGNKGDKGDTGAQGPQGEQGESIYDLAVKYHHFVGTEEEFEQQYQDILQAAVTAAENCAAASATAAQDHTRAGNDHTRAEGDHSTAASDHTQAGQDHTTASADHTQAGNDHTRAEGDHSQSVADHALLDDAISAAGTATAAANTAAAAADEAAEDAEQVAFFIVDTKTLGWESGTLSTATGAESSNAKRVRTGYIPANAHYIIKGDTNHLVTVRFYDEKQAFLSSAPSTWTTDFNLVTAIPTGCAFFRLVGRNGTDTDITNIAGFCAGYKIVESTVDFLSRNVGVEDFIGNFNVKKIAYKLTNSYVVDARTDSTTFGRDVSTTSTWGVSQYVYLQGARYLRIYHNVVTTATVPSCSGIVFYDKDYAPMTAGLWRNILGGTGSVSFAQWDVIEIPTGAMYMRAGVSNLVATTYTYGIELYAIAPAQLAEGRNEYTKPYFGEPVVLRQNHYEWRGLKGISNTAESQSAAIYDKYVFIVKHSLTRVTVFDIESLTMLCSVVTGFPQISNYHCNQLQFGAIKYDDADFFPLLYTEAQNDGAGRCIIYAYRVVPTFTNGVITDVALTLAQTINLPVMTDDNCLGNANPAFDYDNNCIWLYSRNNREGADNQYRARFSKIAIPALYNGGTLISEVTLTDADILDAFDCDFSMRYAQGGFIDNGRLYFGQGGPSYDNTVLRVVDLYAQKRQVSIFDLAKDGLNQEPEGAFVYNGHIYIHCYNGVLYRLDI